VVSENVNLEIGQFELVVKYDGLISKLEVPPDPDNVLAKLGCQALVGTMALLIIEIEVS